MKNKILTLILLASALCPGCSGWLDVKPYDQISEEELLESEEGFQKLLNGIYIELNSDELYGSTLSVEMIEILGGAYEIGDNSSVWGDYLDLKDYDYNTDYWRGRLNGTWNKAYALILNCNKLLKNIQGRHAEDDFPEDDPDFTDDEVSTCCGFSDRSIRSIPTGRPFPITRTRR